MDRRGSEIPGVLKYGQSREEAIAQAEALALRVLRTESSMESSRLNRFILRSPLHDSMAEQEGQASSCNARANRLGREAFVRVSPNSSQARLSGFRFRISRQRRDWAANAGSDRKAHEAEAPRPLTVWIEM